MLATDIYTAIYQDKQTALGLQEGDRHHYCAFIPGQWDSLISEDLAMVGSLVTPSKDAIVLMCMAQKRRTDVQQRAHAETRIL